MNPPAPRTRRHAALILLATSAFVAACSDPSSGNGTTPTLTFNGIKTTDGVNLSLSNAYGRFLVLYSLLNVGLGSSLAATLNSVPAESCEPITPASTAATCTFNTAAFNAATGVPTFHNGAATLSARITTAAGVSASASTSLTLSNQDLIVSTVNNPTNVSGTLWRGSDMAITLMPILFSNQSAPKISQTSALTSGGGTLVFKPMVLTAPPYTYTVDQTASSGAEGAFRFNPRIWDAGGTDISNQFVFAPTDFNIDLLPPRHTFDMLPATTAITTPALQLGHPTGSYPTGTLIPLARVLNGQAVAKHLPNCDATHIHGSITIVRDPNTGNDGPFTDPEFLYSDPCGHGKVVLQPLDHIDFNATGIIMERSPFSSRFRLYLSDNACDPDALVDDVPVAVGTGPGQSPAPDQTITQSGAFSLSYRLNLSSAYLNKNVCLRYDASDAAVNVMGQKVNLVSKGQLLTKVVDGVIVP